MGYLRKVVRFMALYETLIPVLFQSITAGWEGRLACFHAAFSIVPQAA
jgi:hypothetical protein